VSRFLLFTAIALGFLVLLAAAMAHAPEDTDPAFAPFFRSLAIPQQTKGAHQGEPGVPGSCCNEKDCYVLGKDDLKIEPSRDPDNEQGTYWVRDPQRWQSWLEVEATRILKVDNPTGKYVACIAYHKVLCFALAGGT
jgi:hypothetical protein